MNEYQERSKSPTKLSTTPSRGASSSRSREASPLRSRQDISIRDIPLNAPTQKQSNPIQNELDKKEQRKQFLKDYPLAAKMVKNIKIGENDKKSLETLTKEFINSGFVYTMAPTNPDTFLKGTKKEGDCSTLAKAYIKVAKEYLGIDNVKLGYKKGDFFVPHGGKVLDTNQATGNVDNGKHWVFANHYWVESPIGNIDLLFLGQVVNQSQWINKTNEGKEDEIEYRIFGDYKVYDADFMAVNLAKKYATDLDEAKQGKEAAEAAMKSKLKQDSKKQKSKPGCCLLM